MKFEFRGASWIAVVSGTLWGLPEPGGPIIILWVSNPQNRPEQGENFVNVNKIHSFQAGDSDN